MNNISLGENKMKIFTLFLICLVIGTIANKNDDCKPQGVKLSLGDSFDKSTNYDVELLLLNKDSDYSISYYTLQKCEENYIQLHNENVTFTLTPQNITYFFNDIENQSFSLYIHNYLIDANDLNLEVEQLYNYTLFYSNLNDTNQEILSKGPFEFYHHGNLTQKPFKFGWIADIDVTQDKNGSSLGLKNIDIISDLIKNNQSEFVTILGGGDYAYRLETNNGTVGLDFLQKTEKLFSKIPLIAVAGNHEINFPNYDFKFFQGLYRNPRNFVSNSEYYTVSLGKVLLIGLNTNYYEVSKENPFYPDGQIVYFQEKIQEISIWLDKTIKELKDQHDWIIVFSHLPIYCTDLTNISCQKGSEKLVDLENVIINNHVDVYISGHLHNYERIHPIYGDTFMFNQTEECSIISCSRYVDPQAPVYIIDGTVGNTYWLNNTEGYPQNSNISLTNDSKLGFSYFTLLKEDELEFRHYRTDPLELFDTVVIKKNLKKEQQTEDKSFDINEIDPLVVILGLVFIILVIKILLKLVSSGNQGYETIKKEHHD